MRGNKGFTLVELLVVIVILGIITGISIPLIRNIQEKNEQKQYTTYMDGLKVSAKLYVDSYSDDLFGHEKSGCAIIKYSQLLEKGLVKDIAIGDVSCASNDTLVRVVKIDDKITYTPMIGCGKVVGDSIEVDTILPEGSGGSPLTCGADPHTIISFQTNPVYPDTSINFQKRNITVLLNSYTGVHEDIQIFYGFAFNKPEDEHQEPTLVNGWNKLKVNYTGGNEQKKLIADGREIQLSSETIVTPDHLTGDYYVVLRIEALKDISGRNWTNNPNQSKYVYLGTFRLDNEKPVFANTSGVISSNDSYHHIQPKLNINVTDNYSNSSNLRMCISYDSDTCSKSMGDIKNNNGYETYNGSKVLSKIQDNYDGSTHTVYVTVGDAAGNYETQSYSYKIATRYTLTYNSNGGEACDPSSKSVSFDETAPKWGSLCSTSRDKYTFKNWNTASNGSGTTITADTIATSNLTIYAVWEAINYTITYDLAGGRVSTANPATYNVETNNFTLTNPTRSGYVFTGWTGTNGTTPQKNITISKGSSGDRTYTANWRQDKCWERRVKGECGRWRECDYERRSTSWTSEPDCDHYCAGSNWGHENRRCVCYQHGRDPSCGCEYHRWSDWERVQSCTPEPDRVQCRNVC